MAGIVGLTELQHTNATSAMTIDTGGNLTIKTGTTTVKGEGTNTTNLQQGLTKWFATHRGDFSNAVEDSFNVASHTDTGTGGVRYNFTNNMGNTDYCPHVTGINGDHLISTQGDVAASSCRFGHYNQSNGLTDPGFSSHSAVGDLA